MSIVPRIVKDSAQSVLMLDVHGSLVGPWVKSGQSAIPSMKVQ